jgi:hypothetical protein
MNIEILKRDIALDSLGIGELDDKSKQIMDFLNEHLTDLNQYTRDELPNKIYFGKSKDSIVLEYDLKNEWIWVDHMTIWLFFLTKMDMEYMEIQALIQWWVETTLNLKISHITFEHTVFFQFVETTLNLKISHILPGFGELELYG